MIKVFVGTMWCGENEFYGSTKSILCQKDVQIERFVVQGMREREAHATLYSKWNSLKHEYDMFVQVDPDTIILNSDCFINAYHLLQTKLQEGFTSLQYPLDDFLSNENIMGLNFFSKNVVFNEPKDEVYCDRATSNNITFLCKNLIVGLHSPDPSPHQAFHYGLHRGLKNQYARKKAIELANLVSPDIRRNLAIKGFELSMKIVDSKKTSYFDKEFFDLYLKACSEV